jgi:hypothetical protein
MKYVIGVDVGGTFTKDLRPFLQETSRITHGTTASTNTVFTWTGAKVGMLCIKGLGAGSHRPIEKNLYLKSGQKEKIVYSPQRRSGHRFCPGRMRCRQSPGTLEADMAKTNALRNTHVRIQKIRGIINNFSRKITP